jgi:hypothetical protein
MSIINKISHKIQHNSVSNKTDFKFKSLKQIFNSKSRCLLFVSLLFVILLISSPFISVFIQSASAEAGPWTVTFITGAGTTESNRVYTVPDGTLLRDFPGVNLADPANMVGSSMFTGWLPALDEDVVVKSDLTYNATWIIDWTGGSPSISHRWSVVLNNPAYISWKVPYGALKLDFSGESNSDQSFLDYAYLAMDDFGQMSMYFLCLARQGSAQGETMTFAGVGATRLDTKTYADGIRYSVWKLDLTPIMLNTLMTGGTLRGDFEYRNGSGNGQTVTINGLSFTNVRVVADHYTYTHNISDAVF